MIRLSLWVLGLSVYAAACGSEPPPPAPTVALATPVRGVVQVTRDDHTVEASSALRIEEGATLTAGDAGPVSIDTDRGAWVLLDRGGAMTLELDALTLDSGRIFVDSGPTESVIETAHGTLSAAEATFAVDVVDGAVEVYCASGELTYRQEEEGGQLAAGETVRLTATEAVAGAAELWDDWTGGLADPTPRPKEKAGFIGVLAGRRFDQLGTARRALPIRGQNVQVRIQGDLAETTVEQTFFNARSEELEGIYSSRIPEGAVVSSFEVDTGAGFRPSHPQVMRTEQYHVPFGPPNLGGSRLAYDGPGRVRARIYPVTPGATIRVRLGYTEWLERRERLRTYVYPMRGDGAPPLIGEFVLQVDASGTPTSGFRAGMGAEVEGTQVTLRRSDFYPTADFYLDLVDVGAAETAKIYQARPAAEDLDDERYVLVDIPTAGFHEDSSEAPLDLVVVVDVSGATENEDLELARAVLEGTLRQLAPTDRVTVRVADVTARSPDGAPELPAEATPELKETLLESLARVNVGGATDLGTSLRDAARLVAGKPRGAVLYLGDAQPTSGALDATALRRQLATLDAPPRFFGIAMGEHANLTLLRALFGDAQAAEIGERTEAPRLLMRFLADAARPTLRGVSVDLGEGVERVFPRPPITLADGHHLRLVGRLVDDLPTSVRIRGTRDGTPFEETMALTPTRADDHGDIRRRWAVHRLTELIDAQAGKESLAELGVRFSVLTPWTSLVVDGDPTATYEPILNFDDNPRRSHWATPLESLAATRGWRRRMPTATEEAAMVPEHTWVRRGGPVPEGEPTGDGGLRQATMQRIVSTETRGPQACYERKLLVRPDLRGDVSVELTVAGDGTLADAKLATTNLRAEDVETCILTEVRGLRFPASAGGETTTIRHTYEFRSPGRAIGVGRQCSDASRQGLEVRAALWRERLVANAGVRGALSVYREAQAQCELSDWRSRRTLLQAMLRSLGAIDAKLRLYVALGAESATGRYLRRAILLSVRTPADVAAVRAALNLDVALDYTVFLRLWKRNEDPEARLRLVREWLEAAPDDFDLRLRLLALLEETGKLQEARRLARELRADPLADARVRTAVGEFWRRQDNDEEARRVFSEIVERAPLDPWARRRLGDLYRAHGWPDDAYREYQTLRRLRPGDPSVLLDLAAAAADAGRVDEALRLEQELSESAASDRAAGAARYARLWNQVRLARLRGSADATLRPRIQERMRRAGVLRNPPALLVALTWAHPADAPQLFIQYPQEGEEKLWSRTDEQGTQFRIEAAAIREREPGSYLFEVRREDAEDLRPLEGELLVIAQPYTPDERILRLPVTLPRGTEKVGFELSPRDELTENLE